MNDAYESYFNLITQKNIKCHRKDSFKISRNSYIDPCADKEVRKNY